VRSVKSDPVDLRDLHLAGAGGLAGLGGHVLQAGHQPSGVWYDCEAFGQADPFAAPFKAFAESSLKPRESLEVVSAPTSGGYLSHPASPPTTVGLKPHRGGFLEDAKGWSSILHAHSAALPAGFAKARQDLEQHAVMEELHTMVRAIPLRIAFTALANRREVPVATLARRQLAQLLRDCEQLDRERQLRQVEESAAVRARLRAPRTLLDELALMRGLSWHTIASMIAVTPTAIRKWRRGGSLTPDNRQQLASLVGFFDALDQVDNPPQDLGSWVEMPVLEDATLTPAAIYRTGPGGRWLLLEWVRGNLDTTSMLDRHDPDWRARYAPDPVYRVGVGPDGEPAIVPR
jgi:hypothetical protein